MTDPDPGYAEGHSAVNMQMDWRGHYTITCRCGANTRATSEADAKALASVHMETGDPFPVPGE